LGSTSPLGAKVPPWDQTYLWGHISPIGAILKTGRNPSTFYLIFRKKGKSLKMFLKNVFAFFGFVCMYLD
jgi:hypothetical protein